VFNTTSLSSIAFLIELLSLASNSLNFIKFVYPSNVFSKSAVSLSATVISKLPSERIVFVATLPTAPHPPKIAIFFKIHLL